MKLWWEASHLPPLPDLHLGEHLRIGKKGTRRRSRTWQERDDLPLEDFQAEQSATGDTIFTRWNGFIDAGDADVLLKKVMTISEAKKEAMTLEHCAGFYYQGKPKCKGEVEVTFTSTCTISTHSWHTYTAYKVKDNRAR